ncbi:MAG: ribosome biogenesis GTP-binding protein YihA/YsxC [Candidatus Eisenbacteria bacterium]
MKKPLSLEYERSVTKLGDLPRPHHPEVALLGRSNVGKSSLLNVLGGRKDLARTSRTPGRTRAINYYRGDRLYLVDLPGYGFADVPDSVRRAWGALVEGYLQKRESLAAGLLVLDLRRVPNEMDRIMSRWLVDREIPWLAVLTKSDKLKRGEIRGAVDRITETLELRPEQILLFSAKTGAGREPLTGWIRSLNES